MKLHVAVFALVLLASCRKTQDDSKRAEAMVPVTVNALGRIEPQGSIRTISAAAGIDGGRIGRMLVEEGMRVGAGAPLFTLDSTHRLKAALVQARQNESVAVARVAQVRAGAKLSEINAQGEEINRLEAEGELALVQAERAERLLSSGDIPAREAERRRLHVQTLANDLKRARAQLAALREIRPVDVLLAEQERDLSHAATTVAAEQFRAATVVAPVSGVILRIYNRPGEAATTRVLDLGETGRMTVVAEVYEADIRRVRRGQAAEVSLPNLKELLYGRVEQVGQFVGKRETLNADPVSETEARVFRVRIALHPSSSKRAERLSNMQVEVKLLP